MPPPKAQTPEPRTVPSSHAKKRQPVPVEHNEVRSIISDRTKHTRLLGYNAMLPPPLYQASEPGKPDLSRPVKLTSREVSDKLVAALNRTFPLPPVDAEVEEEKKAPFRTAFSSIKSLPNPKRRAGKKKVGNSTSVGDATSQQGSGRTSAQGGPATPLNRSGDRSLRDNVSSGGSDDDDVLPYLAYGPLPDGVRLQRPDPWELSRIKSPKKVKITNPVKKQMPDVHPDGTEPMYVTMAKQWEALEESVFRKERAHRDLKKKQQEVRTENRQARLKLERVERGQRKTLKTTESEGFDIIAQMEREAKQLVEDIERDRQRALEREQKAAAEALKHERHRQAQLERQRLVRERAERIVDVDRVKVEREEQIAFARLIANENEALQKAIRREMMRRQLEADAAEEKRQRDAQAAMNAKLSEQASEEPGSPGSPKGGFSTRPPSGKSSLGDSESAASRPVSAKTTSEVAPGEETPAEEQEEPQQQQSPSRSNSVTPRSKSTTPRKSSRAQTPRDPNNQSTTKAPEDEGVEVHDVVEPLNPEVSTESGPKPDGEPDPLDIESGTDDEKDKEASDSEKSKPEEEGSDLSSGRRMQKQQSVRFGDFSEMPTSPGSVRRTKSLSNVRRRSTYRKQSVAMEMSELMSIREVDEDEYASIRRLSRSSDERRGSKVDPLSFDIVFDIRRRSVMASTERDVLVARDVTLFVRERQEHRTYLSEVFVSVKRPSPCLALMCREQLMDPEPPVRPSGLGLLAEVSGTSALSLVNATSRKKNAESRMGVSRILVAFRTGQQPSDIIQCMRNGKQSKIGDHELNLLENQDDVVSLPEAIDLISSLSILTATMEVGTRTLDVVITLPGIGAARRSTDVRVVAPLFVSGATNDATMLPLKPTDADNVLIMNDVRVSRNPYVSLDSCVLTVTSDKFPYDEWTFEGQESLAVRDTTEELGAAVRSGVITLDEETVATFTKDAGELRVEFGASSRGSHNRAEAIETVMRCIGRRIQCRGDNQQNFHINLTTYDGSLSTTCDVTCEASFVKAPFMVGPKSVCPHRPSSTQDLKLIPQPSLDSLIQGISPSTKLRLELLFADYKADSLDLASGLFYMTRHYLYHGGLRNRMATVDRVNSATLLFEFTVSCNVVDFRTFLSQLVLQQRKSTKLGPRQLRMVIEDPDIPHPVVIDVPVMVGSPLLDDGASKPYMPRFLSMAQAHAIPSWRVPLTFTNPKATAGVNNAAGSLVLPCETIEVHLTSNKAADTKFRIVEPFSLNDKNELVLDGAAVGTVADVQGEYLKVTVQLDRKPQRLQLLLSALTVQVSTTELNRISAVVTDVTNSCADEAVLEVLGYQKDASPSVLLPNTNIQYRQGSQEAAAGYQLLKNARIALPDFKTFTHCDVVVELVSGGSGDGGDVVEFLSAEQQMESFSALDPYGVIQTSGKTLVWQNHNIGTWEATNMGTNLKISFNVPKLLPPLASPGDTPPVSAREVAASEGSKESSRRTSILSMEATPRGSLDDGLISALLRRVAFRNHDPRLKAGLRIYAVRAIFNREEFKAKVNLDVSGALIAIPSFGKKVVIASNTLLPSISPKIVVNAAGDQLLDLSIIRAEITDGATWGVREDKIFINPDDSFDVQNGIVSHPITGKIGKITYSDTAFVIRPDPNVKLSGRILQMLLRSVCYECTTTNLTPPQRRVEFFAELTSGDRYFDTINIHVHVQDQPPVVNLENVGIQYIMDSEPVFIAPQATIQSASGFEGTPVLKVEFLQQHIKGDTLQVESNEIEGVEFVRPNSVRMDEVEIATVNTKNAHITINFISAISLEMVTAVLRSVAFRHEGRRDRQPQKKVQVAFKPKAKMWTRVPLPIRMHECFLDVNTFLVCRTNNSNAQTLLPEVKMTAGFDIKGITVKIYAIKSITPKMFEGPVPKSGVHPLTEKKLDAKFCVSPNKTVKLVEGNKLELDRTVVAEVHDNAIGPENAVPSLDITFNQQTAVTERQFENVLKAVLVKVSEPQAIRSCAAVAATLPGIGTSVCVVHLNHNAK